MNGYLAFFKKECRENFANHRLLILAAVFVLFGLTNAPFAKYTPEILATLANGFEMTTTPTALDSWVQFYKNLSGVGMSIVIILFGSTMANEYHKGTLVLLVTKGLSRSAVVLAKYSAAVLIMSLCYWLSFALTYGYTVYYWPDQSLDHLVFAASLLWLMGGFYLALLMLGATLFNQAFSAILLTGLVAALLSLTNTFDLFTTYNPIRLISDNLSIIEGSITPDALAGPVIVTFLATILTLTGAVTCFARKAL